MIVRLGIKTLHRCQVVALDWSRFNPSTRLLMAVKLMDLIVTPLGSIAANTAILLKDGPATLVNKVPFFSLICDHCDIFTASPRSSFDLTAAPHARGPVTADRGPPHEITGYGVTPGRARPPRQAGETAKAGLKMGKA